MEDGARVDVDEYEKDSARDFALWKAPKPGETSWDTAIGRGPAGLAHRVLGHGDGVPGRELRPALRRRRPDVPAPRKRDCAERDRDAQDSSRGIGCTCASCWWTAERCRRAKGNFYTLRDLLLKGFKASAIRLALVSVPYRHPLNFTFDSLTDATNAIDRLQDVSGAAERDGNSWRARILVLQEAAKNARARLLRSAGQRFEHRRRAGADFRTGARGEHGHG